MQVKLAKEEAADMEIVSADCFLGHSDHNAGGKKESRSLAQSTECDYIAFYKIKQSVTGFQSI